MAFADEPPNIPNKLNTFSVDGASVSMPLSDFRVRFPNATLDTQAEGTVCYSAVPINGTNRVRFYFCNDRLSNIEVAFAAEQIAANGCEKAFAQKLADEFGFPDRTTTVPELGSISFWCPRDSKHHAELATFCEGSVLTVKDADLSKTTGPQLNPEALMQELRHSHTRFEARAVQFDKEIRRLQQQRAMLKKANVNDHVVEAWDRALSVLARIQATNRMFCQIMQRTLDGDASQEADDALVLSGKRYCWQIGEHDVASKQMIEALVMLEEEAKDKVRAAQEETAERKARVRGITLSGYYALRTGMAKWDVDEVLDSIGVEQASSGTAKIYQWQDGGKIISATFDDGKLVSKAQFGLD